MTQNTKKPKAEINYPLCAYRSNGATLFDMGTESNLFIVNRISERGECKVKSLDSVFCVRCPKYHGCKEPLRLQNENKLITNLYLMEETLKAQLETLEKIRFEYIKNDVQVSKAMNL